MSQRPLRTRAFIVFVFVLVAFAGGLQPTEAKDTWVSVRSKNFQLIGNASEKDVRLVANRLEQFRSVFALLFPRAKLNSPVPTTVIVFKSDSSYKPYKPNPNIAGYFQPGADVNYITLTSERVSGDQSFRVIFHEYVHLLIENTMGPTVPIWFNEGLAEYYSTFDVTDENRKALLGDLIANHVLYLRDSKLLPLRTLFAVDHKSPYYNEGNKMNIFYAESWMLMHYLLQGEGQKRRPQLARFLDLAGSGATIDEAFQQAFQTDVDTFEKSFKSYIQGAAYKRTEVTFKQKLDFDSDMQSSPLSEAEAKSYLGDLLLHSNRLDVAETHLQEALKLDENLPSAQASLGMLRVRQRRMEDARQYLEKAVAGNSRNFLAHYYYAMALSGLSPDASDAVSSYPPEVAQAIRAELRKAIDLKEDFAESYALLGFVNVVRNEELDETITLLKRGLSLSRANQRILFMLAQLYMRKENYAEAKQLLEPMARNSADPEMRQQAQSLLDAVKHTEEALAKFKEWQKQQADRPNAAPPEVTVNGQTGGVVVATDDWNTLLAQSLRRPKEGETRVQGLLTAVECDSKGVTFRVRAGDRQLKFHAADLEHIDFTTFTTDVAGEISCGARKTENAIVVTYLAAKAASRVDGEVSAIEFVPANFVLK